MRAALTAALVATLTTLTTLARVAAAAPVDPVVAANDAFRARNLARLDAQAVRLRGHVLEPYVEYWRVMLAPGDDSIRRYLVRHPGTALADQLRADWIRGLARRGDWTRIAAEGARLEKRDPDVACWTLRARWAGGDRLAGAEMLGGAWHEPRELPDGCAAIAAELAEAGQITPDSIWARTRALVGQGQVSGARATLRLLPRAAQPTPQQLDLAFGTPERMLDRGLYDSRRATDRELAAFAVARIAAADPARAAQYLQRPLRLEPAERAWAFGQLAFIAAQRLQPTALGWFAEARRANLSDDHYAWWARIALREGRYPEVRAAIDRMSPLARDEARWTYWLARAHRASGDAALADRLLARAAKEHDFYGRLAAEALGWQRMPPPPAVAPDRAELDRVGRDPSVIRAVALERAGLRPDAIREWAWATRRWDDRLLAVAARYALDLGLWGRVLDATERTIAAHDLALRYPMPYRSVVGEHAASEGVEIALVYGVMRQESRFAPLAVSSSGARGLMQLMPATASWVAGKLGWRDFRLDRLDDPAVNVQLGTRYLRQLQADFGGNLVLAIAGYNAGPTRAAGWRAARPLEGAIFTESIPLEETRDYVKRVMIGKISYLDLMAGEVASLTARLGTVQAEPGRIDTPPAR